MNFGLTQQMLFNAISTKNAWQQIGLQEGSLTLSKRDQSRAKLIEMETQLHDFMQKNSSNEDDAMYAASVLMKCSMILYTQLLGADDVRELLKVVSEGVDEIEERVMAAVNEEDDDPFAGIDTTLPH